MCYVTLCCTAVIARVAVRTFAGHILWLWEFYRLRFYSSSPETVNTALGVAKVSQTLQTRQLKFLLPWSSLRSICPKENNPGLSIISTMTKGKALGKVPWPLPQQFESIES